MQEKESTFTSTELKQLAYSSDVRSRPKKLCLEAAMQGDSSAFGQLVEQHSRLISSITLAITRDLQLAEDVAQEVFVAAWQGLERLRNPDSFLPWLKQLARNRSQDAIRGKCRRNRIGQLTGDETFDQVAARQADPREALIAKEEHEALEDAFDAIDQDDRELLILFYREDQSVRQVAELLELKDQAVKKRLQRARGRLCKASLERFSETLRRTAPGATFTAAVLASLPLLSTSTAAAASGAAGSLKSAPLVSGVSASTLAGLLGTLSGLFSGLAGVFVGYRMNENAARSPQEKAEAKRLAQAGALAVIMLQLAFSLCLVLRSVEGLWLSWVVFTLVNAYLYLWRAPRRSSSTSYTDPQKESEPPNSPLTGWVAFIIGHGMGTLGVAWGATYLG